MRTPTLPSTPSTLVGRDRELGILREHLDAALTGQSSLVLIGGEAGIGKTALAEALCREARERGALVLVGRCYDLTDTPAYGPWLDLFQRYQPRDGLPSRPAPFAERGVVGAVASQAALFREVLDFFRELAAKRLIVLLLDDVHWSDPASLDLLRFLAQSVSPSPVLMLVTYRADELSRHHPFYRLLPTLEHDISAARLDLRRLTPVAVRSLIERRYPLSRADMNRVTAFLVGRAEGNVFFTLQLLRSLEDEGLLGPNADASNVGDLATLPVPMAVLQVIDVRLFRLDAESQRLLGLAAIIGHEVPLPLWAAVGAVDEDTLSDVVERAAAARVLEAVPGGTRARFVHALIRQALYERMPSPQRRRTHLAVAETLIASGTPDPDAIAMHFRQAGDGRAIAWLIRAGGRAEQAYAWLTAADRFGMALAMMREGGTDPQARGWLLFHLAMVTCYTDPDQTIAHLDEAARVAETMDDRTLLAYSIARRGWVRCTSGDQARGLREFEEGVTALDTLPKSEQTLPLSLGDVLRGFNDHAVLSLYLAQAGRYADARVRAEEVIAHGLATERAHFAMGFVNMAMGEPDAARRSFALAREGLRLLDHSYVEGWVTFFELTSVVLPYQTDRVTERRRLAAMARRAWANAGSIQRINIPEAALLPLQFVEGDWHDARLAAITARTAGGTNVVTRFPTRVLCQIALAQGDTALAWSALREHLPAGVDTEIGDIDFIVALELQQLAASLAIAARDLNTARRWLDAHDRWLASNGAVLGRSEGHALWANYFRAHGDVRRSYQHATHALSCAREPRQPLALLVAHRLLGELNTAMGRVAYAATHLDAALGLATECAAPYERALTLLALADLRAVTGQHAQATVLLCEVRAICAPLGAAPALARAEATEARLCSSDGTAPAVHPAGLTSREVEVLRLIAIGHTNRDIGDVLFISERTVQVHVRHILTKTGAENRAGATAFAVRHGLD